VIPRLVGAAIAHRRLTIALWGAFLAIAGAIALRLELDALPDLTNNQVQVLTRAPGLTPEEVELRVTRPLEAALGGLPGLEQHRSLSRYGLSAVTAIFEDDVDPFRARQLVAERIQVASLPEGVDPPELGPMSGGLGEVYQFSVSSPQRSAAELLELVTLRVVPTLRMVPGIVEVNTWGGQRRVFEVHADPIRLAQRQVTFGELEAALGRAIGQAPGASLATGGTQILLRGVFLPKDVSGLGHAMVKQGGAGEAIRVGDVADLREGGAFRLGAATANGGGEIVYVMAQMLVGANAKEVVAGVKEKMTAVRQLLPEDVRVEVVYDRSALVDGTLRTVGLNLLEGGLLVVAVLFLMLGSARAGIVVALAIPISMVGATAAMALLGIPGNLLSLGALDFGLLVDGAVVFVEHVFHTLGREAGGGEADARESWPARVRRVSLPVAWPVFSSVLVILLVYVPVLALTGADGKMFRPMALTVVFALSTSLVLSLTFVPAAVSTFMGPAHIPPRPPWLVRKVEAAHRWALAAVSARRGLTAAGALVLLAIAGFVLVRMGSEFVPQLDEGDLVIQTTRASDISLDEGVAAATRLERLLEAKIPEVERVASRIGSPAVATDVMGIEQADVFVGLAPRGAWRPGLEKEALVAEMEAVIKAADPEADPSFTQPIQMRFNELLGGSPTDVVVSVFGEDLAAAGGIAQRVRAAVAPIAGVQDARVLAPPSVALLEVTPRPLEAAQAGFSVAEVLDAVQAARLGLEVAVTYDRQVPIPVVLRLGAAGTPEALAALALPDGRGGTVPLARLATFERRETPTLVQHDNGLRRVLVGFNVRGADLGAVAQAARARVAAEVPLPAGVRLAWGGQIETLEAANRRLALVAPLVLALIAGLLLFTFRRLRDVLVVLTHVPFAATGGVFALAARGLPLSVSAAVGFIALSGVAVMNGVVLLARIRENELAGLAPAEAALRGARERARAVLMTALVAALGFVPMMLARGVGAEVQRPLATAVCGGLFTSTLLTLFILPTLYPWFAAGRGRRA
jgi:cobalt-zinc-cadmium resistance protein CzcA